MVARANILVILMAALALGGCADESAPEGEEPEASLEQEPGGLWYDDGVEYETPCVYPHVVNGKAVWVPIPCVEEGRDKGDPSPEREALRPGEDRMIEPQSTKADSR